MRIAIPRQNSTLCSTHQQGLRASSASEQAHRCACMQCTLPGKEAPPSSACFASLSSAPSCFYLKQCTGKKVSSRPTTAFTGAVALKYGDEGSEAPTTL